MHISADNIHLLALCAIPQLGAVTRRRLMRAFGSAEDVFKADFEALCEVEGISDTRANAVKDFGSIGAFEQKLENVRASGADIVACGGPGYPAPLESLGEESPLVLYIKGKWLESDANSVAIVGSRKATPYGLRMAGRISSDLGAKGVTVTSGMAMGIDTEAHRGSMQGGGRTLAVLGTGIDVIFPAGNRGLMGRIETYGAVITEFPPGTPGLAMNFPIRNRLISALSLGVLVVEAAAKSGSLITAGHALAQDKPVFAVPGNADSEYSEGANELIRRGARVITDAEHIIEALSPSLKGLRRGGEAARMPDLSAEEKALCSHMGRAPLHIDEIVKLSGLTVPKALSLLLTLELKEAVKQEEGKRFYIK
ncbi:MAG: DNA-processing protein DprA [Thermodesulfovibrionales bacterium]|nr:DNA-processing protein DprA [Thermodesulfovibrionales bacterium]